MTLGGRELRSRLGRYELGSLLGEGGSGRVFEAALHGPNGARPVALKVLHEGAEVLRREARIGALLRHRNLVDVFELGEHQGQWFCAMELCTGGSLRAYAPLPPRAVVEVGLAVCAALQYAYDELGLVHLDLKPDNLLLADGVVKVADLGIAHARGFSQDGRIRGTAGFLAPEQARGEAVDTRTDVFALGVTLEVLSTGLHPGSSRTMDLCSLAQDGPGEASVAAGSTWLTSVLDRCVAPSPADRWENMAALAVALRSLSVEGPGLREVLGLGPPLAKAVRGRIGVEEDHFVGRERELEEILPRLSGGSWLTLKGPAGIGKSRLALAAARRWLLHSVGLGLYCDLAGLSTVDGILGKIGRSIELTLDAAEDQAVDRIGHAVANRGALVWVLDNFEGGRSLAWLVERWATLAPHARIVVTTRESLRVDGEAVVEVEPLGLEASMALLSARALQRDVDVASDPDLPELARRLDGMPLALELAAGRLGVLSVRDVLDRFGLSLLRGAGDDRHSTLRAALDWSAALLSDAARVALGQLSVFEGGWRVEAAEAVLDLRTWPTLCAPDVLAELMDASIVRQDPATGRFSMLGVVAAWAREQLEDARAAEARHGRYFARFGTVESIASLSSTGGGARLAERANEYANLVAATVRAVERREVEVAMSTVRAVVDVVRLCGPVGADLPRLEAVARLPLSNAEDLELRNWLAQAKAATGAGAEVLSELSAARALATKSGELRLAVALGITHSRVLFNTGRTEEALAVSEVAGALARSVGDRLGIALSRSNAATALLVVGRVAEAEAAANDALRLFDEQGSLVDRAHAEGTLGRAALDRGEVARGMEYFSRSVQSYSLAGAHRFRGEALVNLAISYGQGGRAAEAKAAYAEGRAAYRRVGDRRGEALILLNLGGLHRDLFETSEAERALVESVAVLREGNDLRLLGVALGNLAIVYGDAARPEDSLTTQREALAVHRAAHNRRSEGVSLHNLGAIHGRLGDLKESVTLVREGLAIHREVGNLRFEALALMFLAEREDDVGRPEDGERLHREALALTRRTGNRITEGYCLRAFALHLRDRDQLDEAEQACAEAMVLASEAGDLHEQGILWATRAEIAFRAGRFDQAQTHCDEATRRGTELRADDILLACDVVRSALYAREGREEEVQRSLVDAAARAHRIGWNEERFQAAYAHVRAYAVLRRDDLLPEVAHTAWGLLARTGRGPEGGWARELERWARRPVDNG